MVDPRLTRIVAFVDAANKVNEDLAKRWTELQEAKGEERMAEAKDHSYYTLFLALIAALSSLPHRSREQYLHQSSI